MVHPSFWRALSRCLECDRCRGLVGLRFQQAMVPDGLEEVISVVKGGALDNLGPSSSSKTLVFDDCIRWHQVLSS